MSLQSSFSKQYTSALSVVPPRRIWDAIQQARCFNDRNFVRWPPHINLLYPFVADKKSDLEAAARLASEELCKLEPFEITLDKVAFFKHRGSCTLLLAPQSQKLLDLQAALQRVFPDFNDTSLDEHGNFRGFNPHLSLGQSKNDQVEAQQQVLQSEFKPVTFTVDRVDIITREGPPEKPFKFRFKIPVGSTAYQEVNAPYVATVGPYKETETKADKYGMGAMAEGSVWYYAFGANMSRKKLTGSRQIEPLESVAVKLPGWALDFNHRGAMGNLVELGPREKGPGGFTESHGVAYRIKPNDFARLTGMEHEYRPTEVTLDRYDRQGQIKAVAFISPQEKNIQSGLPTTDRYANLLRAGAREFKLDAAFQDWLDAMPTVSSEGKRGDEYWHDLNGAYLPMRPRIWSGSDQSRSRGGRGVRRGRGGGRGPREGTGGRKEGREGGRGTGKASR